MFFKIVFKTEIKHIWVNILICAKCLLNLLYTREATAHIFFKKKEWDKGEEQVQNLGKGSAIKHLQKTEGKHLLFTCVTFSFNSQHCTSLHYFPLWQQGGQFPVPLLFN